jgi:hypothetical protein
VNKYNDRAWAPSGNPLSKQYKYHPQKYVACIAAIGPKKGLLYADYKYAAFNSEDMINFLLRIRALHTPDHKIAIFLDNCSVHKSKATRKRAKNADINIELVYNIPYRPDLNGIEFFWGHAKRSYRKHLMQYKAEGVLFDNWGLA